MAQAGHRYRSPADLSRSAYKDSQDGLEEQGESNILNKRHRQHAFRQSRTHGDGAPPSGPWENAETQPDRVKPTPEEFEALVHRMLGPARAAQALADHGDRRVPRVYHAPGERAGLRVRPEDIQIEDPPIREV